MLCRYSGKGKRGRENERTRRGQNKSIKTLKQTKIAFETLPFDTLRFSRLCAGGFMLMKGKHKFVTAVKIPVLASGGWRGHVIASDTGDVGVGERR